MKKKIIIIFIPLIFTGITIILSISCKKEEEVKTGTVTDVEGTVYQTVKIGNQWWMAENLNTTSYNDGVVIPHIADSTEWENLTTAAYCFYNNDESTYRNTYGVLYNWFTVSSGKLCPAGWHVPSDSEVTTLTNALGGLAVAGGKLKEKGTLHWCSPNIGATNESGFTALPGGCRNDDSTFGTITIACFLWSSTEHPIPNLAYYWCMLFTQNDVFINGHDERKGFSVRCIKD